MKQILRVILFAAVICSLGGCGGDAGDPPVVSADQEAKQQEMRKQQRDETEKQSREAYKSSSADDPNARRKPSGDPRR